MLIQDQKISILQIIIKISVKNKWWNSFRSKSLWYLFWNACWDIRFFISTKLSMVLNQSQFLIHKINCPKNLNLTPLGLKMLCLIILSIALYKIHWVLDGLAPMMGCVDMMVKIIKYLDNLWITKILYQIISYNHYLYWKLFTILQVGNSCSFYWNLSFLIIL